MAAPTSPLAGTVAAFATFGVGYLARPLGALLFGHIGDKYGRRVVGVYCGVALASLVGTIAYSLPQEQLLSWGWRIPFLVSIALVVTGLWVRMRIGESPAFTAHSHRGATPLAEMVRQSPRRLLLAIVLVVPVATASVIVLVYSLAYAASVGTPKSVLLLGSLLGAALGIATAPLAGHLGDRFGRRRVYIVLYLATAAWAFPFFALLSTAQTWAVIVAHLVVAPTAWAITGVQAAYIAELFSTRYRLSGVALSKEICTALTAPLPIICVALAAALDGAPWLVAAVFAVSGLAGFAALLILPETLPLMPEGAHRV